MPARFHPRSFQIKWFRCCCLPLWKRSRCGLHFDMDSSQARRIEQNLFKHSTHRFEPTQSIHIKLLKSNSKFKVVFRKETEIHPKCLLAVGHPWKNTHKLYELMPLCRNAALFVALCRPTFQQTYLNFN